jgi:hypothetical protein
LIEVEEIIASVILMGILLCFVVLVVLAFLKARQWWCDGKFSLVPDRRGMPRLKSQFSIVDTFDDVQKLASLNLVLRTTLLTPVQRQISKLQAEKSCQLHGFKLTEPFCNGSTHERC